MSALELQHKFNLSVSDQKLYFSEQWEAHRKDLKARHWTNMTLVGVSSNGNSSSVEVHQAIVLPLCQNLLDGAVPDVQEDPVFIFPETSASVLHAVVNYIYNGVVRVVGSDEWIETFTILRTLGVPLNPSVKFPARNNLGPAVSRLGRDRGPGKKLTHRHRLHQVIQRLRQTIQRPLLPTSNRGGGGFSSPDVRPLLPSPPSALPEDEGPSKLEPGPLVEATTPASPSDSSRGTSSSSLTPQQGEKFRSGGDDSSAEKSLKVESESNINKTNKSKFRLISASQSLQTENDQSMPEVNSNSLNTWKDKINKVQRSFNDKNPSTGLYQCQLCSQGVSTIKKLVEHSVQEHAGETYHCLEDGCQFETVNYCSLRTHYYCKTKKPVQTKNSNTFTPITLEIIEENDVEQSITEKVKGFACPYDSCSFITKVNNFDLDHEEALATLYQHEDEIHRTPRERCCYHLLFHELSEGETDGGNDD